jgi:hypothetical protein
MRRSLSMPALQTYIIEPVWEQLCALLPERDLDHPLGCHRARICERVVFEKLVQVLVFGGSSTGGSPTKRVGRPPCVADGTSGSRGRGDVAALEGIARDAYDRFVGLELHDIAVDCCITKAPCDGGLKAGRSPVDRGKQGLSSARPSTFSRLGLPLKKGSSRPKRSAAAGARW